MKRVLVEVWVEQKSEHGAANDLPPSDEWVAAIVKDYGRDATRGEYDMNWKIVDAQPVRPWSPSSLPA